MLEILAVIALSKKIAEIANEKGRSGAWGFLGATGWFTGEVFGFIIGVMVTESLFGAYFFGLAGAIGGAVVAWQVVKNLPLASHFQPVGTPAMVASGYSGVAPATAMAASPAVAAPPRPKKRAGHCMECGKNVWLTETGSCPAGHGPQSLTKIYTVDG